MTANCLASTEFVAMLFIFDLERDPTVFISIKCFRISKEKQSEVVNFIQTCQFGTKSKVIRERLRVKG